MLSHRYIYICLIVVSRCSHLVNLLFNHTDLWHVCVHPSESVFYIWQHDWYTVSQCVSSDLSFIRKQSLTIMYQLWVSLFVPMYYKSAPLRGSPWNVPCPLRGAWVIFLGEWRVTNCPLVAQDCASIFRPRAKTPFYSMSCAFWRALQNVYTLQR